MDTFLSAGAGADASPAARSGSAMDFVDARRAALFGRRDRGAERRTASTTIGVARARAMTGVGRARRRGNADGEKARGGDVDTVSFAGSAHGES